MSKFIMMHDLIQSHKKIIPKVRHIWWNTLYAR